MQAFGPQSLGLEWNWGNSPAETVWCQELPNLAQGAQPLGSQFQGRGGSEAVLGARGGDGGRHGFVEAHPHSWCS